MSKNLKWVATRAIGLSGLLPLFLFSFILFGEKMGLVKENVLHDIDMDLFMQTCRILFIPCAPIALIIGEYDENIESTWERLYIMVVYGAYLFQFLVAVCLLFFILF